MKKIIKKFFKKIATWLKKTKRFVFLTNKYNFYIFRVTQIDNLNLFLSRIKPITTEYELVRFGHDADGGYLIPNDLQGISILFSPGVSNQAYFENDLSKLGIKSYMADFSINNPPIKNIYFDFIKMNIGFENEPNNINLENWIKSNVKFEEDMILQMDIEGGEYNVIIETPSELFKKFRIIVIEFHSLDLLLNNASFNFIKACFYKLIKDFYIVHIHPNNSSDVAKYRHIEIPSIMEFTFIRKDRVSNVKKSVNFPHHLDKKNIQDNEELILPKCFYL